MVSFTMLVSEYTELFKLFFLLGLYNHVIENVHERWCLILLLPKKLKKCFKCGVFVSPFPKCIFQIYFSVFIINFKNEKEEP